MASAEAKLYEYTGPLAYVVQFGVAVKSGDRVWIAGGCAAQGFTEVEEPKKGDPKPLNSKADAAAVVESGGLGGSGEITEADR